MEPECLEPEDLENLLHKLESRYHLEVFENISESAISRLPLAQRLAIIGNALIYRTDFEGYALGRKLIARAGDLTPEC